MKATSATAIEVEDLDDAGLLDAAAEAERRDREVQRDKLRLAYQWCVLHPATARVRDRDLGRRRPPRPLGLRRQPRR